MLIDLRELTWRQLWAIIENIKNELKERKLPLVVELGRAPLLTETGDWTHLIFGYYTDGSHHEVLVFGDLDKGSLGDGEDLLTRIHSSCRTGESYMRIIVNVENNWKRQ